MRFQSFFQIKGKDFSEGGLRIVWKREYKYLKGKESKSNERDLRFVSFHTLYCSSIIVIIIMFKSMKLKWADYAARMRNDTLIQRLNKKTWKEKILWET
jgi:hypothetical protein